MIGNHGLMMGEEEKEINKHNGYQQYGAFTGHGKKKNWKKKGYRI